MEEAQQKSGSQTDELAAEIRRDLLNWYRANKRNLPWRGADAYGVWISEIMLQQTQVATVIPYYLQFIKLFPNIESLASASLNDVLKCWAGLGYYARARNLHRAAGIVVDRHFGLVPDVFTDIVELPGIGAYTAGAILSIAYDQRYPAIDANVVRVLCRVFGIRGDPKSSTTQLEIRRAADRLTPAENPGEFNQALMELGALMCDPADPHCELCPLIVCCKAGNSTNPTDLPEYAAAGAITKLKHSCVVIQNDGGKVLVVQRPAHGLWGGLWEFPRVVCKADERPEDAAVRAAREIAGIELICISKLALLKHSVTRYRITLHAFKASVAAEADLSDRSDKSYGSYDCLDWVDPAKLTDFPFSSPQSLVCKALLG